MMLDMRYIGNPCTPSVRAAMSAGHLDCITTPGQGNRIPEGAWFCADNGCFGKNYVGDDAWWIWLFNLNPERCRFAVAPDVVGDAVATLNRSLPWLAKIRSIGLPAAFVIQDGIEKTDVPWDEFDVLFIGGSTEFKLGEEARVVVAEARKRGIPVHMGRVNSRKRLQYADAIGCDSVDGTYISFGPEKNLARMLGWVREVNEQPAMFDRSLG